MWPFSKNRSEDVVTALQKEVKSLRNTCADLDERLEALRAQHLSLRGRVYALWGRDEPPDKTVAPPTSAKPAQTRDELRAEMVRAGRIMPGKPTNHSQE